MNINMEITDKQARKLADRIMRSGFAAYAIGNFDISDKEFSTVIKKAFNNTSDIKALDELFSYYEELRKQNGLE